MLAGNAKKGDVLGAARIAGIMAAKKTHELIPLCHPLPLTKVAVDIAPDHDAAGPRRRARPCKVTGQTGVEMEALTAVSVACLTIYDMVKAVERGMRIEGIRLVEKGGGKSGRLSREGVRRWRCCRSPRRSPACSRASKPLPAEQVPLAEAHGRVLAGDVAALRTQPPVDASAMDGYAVRAADVASAPARAQASSARSRPAVRSPARSAPAKPCASSPARRCPPAPTPS